MFCASYQRQLRYEKAFLFVKLKFIAFVCLINSKKSDLSKANTDLVNLLLNKTKQNSAVGWAMQIAGFIFLDRKWDEDQQNISKCLKVFKETDYKPQVC